MGRRWGRFAGRLRRLVLGKLPPHRIAYAPAQSVSDPRWEQARTISTKRGDKVRSWGEARVADRLHDLGVRYEYEPLVQGRRPDFYLPELGVIVEYSGVEREDYAKRHEDRMRIYARARIPVIALRGKRWKEVDAALEKGLRRWGWRP